MNGLRPLIVGLAFLAIWMPLSAAENGTTVPDEVVTLLFTNDIESAYDPVPAYWIDGMSNIGGIAELTTLVHTIRESEPNVFLFDAGDIFTGALSRLTDGALMFEFMISMGYDAMGIGNHEFDYGTEVFEWQKNRAPFPVLGANLFYKDTSYPFSQPHAIIERNGIRIGVVGVLGQDAASSAIAPAHIAPLDVTDPVEAARRSVAELRDEVDLIILLTHQGHTAPMQTDAEIDPRLQRDINADIEMAGAVKGVDVLFAGHADAGTPEPVVHEETGTLIMQTYGQATYLGYLQLVLDGQTRKIKSHDGKLIAVDSDSLIPDPVISEKNAQYRAAYPEIQEVVGRTEGRLNRKYFDESSIGNLIADIFVEATGADIGMMHPGGIRKDLPSGDIAIVDILDMSPFVDNALVMEVTGSQLRQILEQSFTLDRGLMQVAGIEVDYDTSRPMRQRLQAVRFKGREVADSDTFSVVVSGIIARGGDHYDEFLDTKLIREVEPLSNLTIAYFRRHGTVPVPARDRQKDFAQQRALSSAIER